MDGIAIFSLKKQAQRAVHYKAVQERHANAIDTERGYDT